MEVVFPAEVESWLEGVEEERLPGLMVEADLMSETPFGLRIGAVRSGAPKAGKHSQSRLSIYRPFDGFDIEAVGVL